MSAFKALMRSMTKKFSDSVQVAGRLGFS